MAGEAFSVADITARVTLDFTAKALDLPPPDQAKALLRWYESLSTRPSIEP